VATVAAMRYYQKSGEAIVPTWSRKGCMLDGEGNGSLSKGVKPPNHVRELFSMRLVTESRIEAAPLDQ
jgi:hypothetical protein